MIINWEWIPLIVSIIFLIISYFLYNIFIDTEPYIVSEFIRLSWIIWYMSIAIYIAILINWLINNIKII